MNRRFERFSLPVRVRWSGCSNVPYRGIYSSTLGTRGRATRDDIKEQSREAISYGRTVRVDVEENRLAVCMETGCLLYSNSRALEEVRVG